MDYAPWVGVLRQELRAVTDPDVCERMQVERCAEVLGHAYAHCPFYRETFDAHGFAPADFRDLRDLARVPVFEKEAIPANQERIRGADVPTADLIASATGGTTGNSFRFWYDRVCWTKRHALNVIANERYGWRVGDPTAVVWNAHQDLPDDVARMKHRLRNWLTRRALFLEASHIDEAGLARWCADLGRHRTQILYGYAQSVREIAAYCEATGTVLPHVRLVVTTAEPLYPADRELLERVFGCDVRDRYASREHGPMAQEDDEGRLEIFANSLILEVDAADGEVGDILVTDLWNRAFPFIRYRIGDTAGAASRRPGALPALALLGGRLTDFLVDENGARVSGMTFHEAYYDPERDDFGSDHFVKIQFVQTSPRDVEVRIVPGPDHDRAADEIRLTALVRQFLGQGMEVVFRYLEEIPRSASGKYRFTVYAVEDGG